MLWFPAAAIGTLAGLLLALAVALWIWAHSAGSFEQTLRWAQAASERQPETLGRLQVELDDGATHRLSDGGAVRRLSWSRGGMSVQLDALELRWPALIPALLSGQGLVIERLAVQRIAIDDQRPPQPTTPPDALELPLPLALPFDVQALHYRGATNVSAHGLRGRYQYQSGQHALQLDTLRWADGHYQGQATLDARAPLQLDLTLNGELRMSPDSGLRPQTVPLRARLRGTLAGAAAALKVEADAPQLQASATLRPWADQPLERADIRLEAFNLAHFWPGAPSTQLSGHVDAQPLSGQTGALWQATARLTNTQPGPWDRQRLPVQRLRVRLEQHPPLAPGQPWRLRELDAVVADGTLTATGDVMLPASGGAPLGWSGQLSWNGWRPQALLSHLPAQRADVDAQARAQGTQTTVALQARAAQATLQAQGRLDPGALGFDGEASLSTPGASLRLKGRLAARDGGGTADLELAQAERLLTWARALLPADVWPAPALQRAEGQASARVQWRGGWQRLDTLEWEAQAQTRGLVLATDTGDLQLSTRLQARQQRGRLSLTTEELRAQARLAGVPDAWARWGLATQSPVRASWGDDGLRVEASRWNLNPPVAGPALELELEPLRWKPSGAPTSPDAGLLSQGRLLGLPLAWLDALPGQPLRGAGLGTNLLLDADWSLDWPLNAGRAPRAQFRLQRRSGDLTWQPDAASPPLTAGVRQLGATLTLDGEQLRLQAQWDSERAGQVQAQVDSRLHRIEGRPDWTADAPLGGRVTAQLPQIGVWSALAPPGWRVAGALSADAELGGTRVAPRFNGSLSATDLSLRAVVDGLEFTNGRLLARLQGERIAIETLTLEGSGGAASGGRLSATGSAEWVDVAGRREPRVALQVNARQLRASTRPDRRLTVSGDLAATLAGTRLALTGDVRADQALILLPDEATPTLGDDVIVRGRAAPAGPHTTRVVPDVNVHLDLGVSFELRGHGLQTRLSGRLNVRSSAQRPVPQVLGEVRTAGGRYRAYGQQLEIEEGVLRFTGPYDNPALEVLAIRPYTTQRVGVLVRGTARAPQVRLYSEPDLPDSEKLAWLVLGRAASGGGAEAAVLQQAALALISGGGGPTLGQRLGLDELSLRGAGNGGGNGNDSSAALTLGKRLSNRLYVSYERSVAGVLGSFAMFYDISRRLTLRARAGDDNALDLIFTVSYD